MDGITGFEPGLGDGLSLRHVLLKIALALERILLVQSGCESRMYTSANFQRLGSDEALLVIQPPLFELFNQKAEQVSLLRLMWLDGGEP